MIIRIDRSQSRDIRIRITIFLILLFSLESLLFGSNSNDLYDVLGAGGLATITFILGLKFVAQHRKINGRVASMAVALIILSIVTMLINDDINIKHVYVWILVILSMFFSSIVSFDEFVKNYCRFMSFISAWSLIVFALWLVAPAIIRLFPKILNVQNYVYYNTFFTVVRERYMYEGPRNEAFFREPGVFAIFLSLALLFEVYYSSEKNLKRIVLYIATMLTTYSTTGYIIVALIVLFYYLIHINETNGNRLKKMISMLLVLVLIYFLLFQHGRDLLWSVFAKIFVNNNNNSKASRFDSVLINLKIVSDNIAKVLIGNGFYYTETHFVSAAQSIGSYAYDNVNTIFRILTTQGLLYDLLLIDGWIRFFKGNFGGKYFWPTFIAFVLLLFSENLMLNPIVFIFAFYGILSMEAQQDYDYSEAVTLPVGREN